MNNQLTTTQTNNPLLLPNALEVAKEEIFKTVNASIAKCYVDLNFKIPEDTEYLVNEVTDAIVDRFPAMRTVEIPTAFFRGIRGEYGEYFGLCVVSFEQFISGYLSSETRKQLVKDRDKLTNVSTEPTADEKFNTAKGLCLAVYEQTKAGRSPGLTATAVYTFLNSIQLIDPEYKKGIMPQALTELVAEKEAEIVNCMQIITRRQLNEKLAFLKQNIASDGINQAQYDECKRVAKRIILTNWLRDQEVSQTDLDQLIESKRELYKTLR